MARILGDGKRQRTRVFSELRSHYLFVDRFGRPGKGNDKGKVEGIVGYCRRNFLVPMPRFRNFDDLNTHLEACCAKRWAEQLRGHDQTVGDRLERDRAVLQRLPAIAYDALRQAPGRVSSAVAGALSRHRLLRPHTVRPLRGAGPRLCPRGGHQLRRRGDCQAPRVHTSKRTSSSIRCTICPCWSKDQRAGSGGSLGRLAVAAGVRRSPPPT